MQGAIQVLGFTLLYFTLLDEKNSERRTHCIQFEHTTQLSDCNFLIRLLYKNTYWLLALCMFSHWCWPALCYAY